MKTIRMMMQYGRHGLFLLAFVFVFAACDSTQSVTQEPALNSEELTAFSEQLTTALSLNESQVARLEGTLNLYEDREPGYLWYVAADLQETLTAEQKEELKAKMEEARENFQMRREQRQGERGERGFRGRRGGPDGPGTRGARGPRGEGSNRSDSPMANLLTDEQREAMQALHTEHREKAQALVQQRDDGSLSTEDFRAQMKTLRDGMKEAMQALLTDEQKATIEQHRTERKEKFEARRDDMMDARVAALDLSTDQQTALKALQEAHRAEAEALIEQARSGDADREALRESFREMRERHQAAHNALLTPAQQETVMIHNALIARAMMSRAKGERNGHRGGIQGRRFRQGSRR